MTWGPQCQLHMIGILPYLGTARPCGGVPKHVSAKTDRDVNQKHVPEPVSPDHYRHDDTATSNRHLIVQLECNLGAAHARHDFSLYRQDSAHAELKPQKMGSAPLGRCSGTCWQAPINHRSPHDRAIAY